MTRLRFSLFALLLPALGLFLVLPGCGLFGTKVSKFAPLGEVRELQTFTLEFDEPIAPQDKQNVWLEDSFLLISPAIPGKYKWTTANTLVFSPAGSLKPAQKYAVRLNPAALSFGVDDRKFRNQTFYFNTPDFKAEGGEIFWKPIPHTEHKVAAQVNLKFTYRPNLDDLKQHLKVLLNGQPYANFTVSADGEGVAVLLGEMQQTTQSQDVTVALMEGLKPTFGYSPLKEEQVFKLSLPPIVKLVVSDIGSGLEGDYGWVELHTSQPFDGDKLGKYVEIQPRPDSVSYEVAENATRIRGHFQPGMEYTVKVSKGAPGLYGGTLEADRQEMVALANLEPKLKFTEKKGMYMLRGGRENMGLEAVNLDKAELRVYEIFRNNILHFFNANYTYNDHYLYDSGEDGEEYWDYSNYEVDGFGRLLYEEKLNFNALDNRRVRTTVNLHKALDTKFKGIYVVQVNNDKDYWLRDAKIVVVSDLGLIVKYTKDECLVFVNGLGTAAPISGVTLKIISTNNQTLAQAVTDATGMARFDKLGALTEGFEPRLITAEYGDDFNFLDLKATEIETSRFDVGGKEITADSYDSFLYGDRNLYRPGETVFLSGIVRDVNIGIVKDVPVNLRITSSTGKIIQQTQHVLNGQGSFETSIALPDYAQTGVYTAELYTGNDRYITGYKFSVEDFVPDQIRVTLDSDKDAVDAGEAVNVSVNAEFLFGAPCVGNKYEADFRLKHKPFTSKKYKEFDFTDNSATNSDIENELMEGRLDENGKAVLAYTVPEDITASGVIEGGAYVSVFDGTGRTVNRKQAFTAFTRDYFIGVKRNRYYFGTGSNIHYDLIALSPKEMALQGFNAEVELIRHEWQTILAQNDGGNYRYVSEEKQITEFKRNVTISGSTGFDFSVKASGQYELRIRKKGEEEYTRAHFYAYGFSNANASSFEVDREGRVDIVMDKESYKPGETAKVLFITPFTGKMLVTVERDRVMEHFMLDVTNNSTELKLLIRDEASPNAYITATLFRPYREISAIPFMVGHGFQGFQVEKPESHLPVSISAPEKVKPKTTQWVTVKSAPQRDIFVTLAAVDEGILQIKNYQTPDPHAHFYAKRKLGVSSYDLYELVMPEMEGASSTAGGDEYLSGKRQNPVKSKRFKLVAMWSGIQRTDENGEVKVKLDIPQFNGEIRLMAVAYDGNRFGSADRPMKVADDLILMPEIPRFLSQNDQLTLPVHVQNTTKKAGKVTVSMSVSGPMKVTSNQSQTVEVPAEGSANAFFEVKTWNEIGEGKISLKTSGLASVSDEIDIPIRPNSPYTVEGNGGELKPGTDLPLNLTGNFVKGTARGNITVAPFPALRFAKSLRYLMGYPHGCLEQTISKAFPQLYLADLMAVTSQEKNGNPAYNIREAVRKVEGLQLYDGSFSYWRGFGSGYDWTTAYAMHFLLEARKAGFEVSDRTINAGLDYLANIVTQKKTTEEYVWNASQKKSEPRKIASRDNLYGLYVLALAQRADIATMNYYLARTNLLTPDSRYLLAGAYGHAKRWSAYNTLIPTGFEPYTGGSFTSDAFDSEIRANAIMLNTLLEVNPSDKQIPTMVNYLASRMGSVYSTQEHAWALLALGKAARQAANSSVTTEVVIDGKVVATLPAKGGVYADNAMFGKTVTLRPKGTGTTYYYAFAEGIRSDGAVPLGDNNLMVRRTFYNREGKQITDNAFGQGQLIVCKLSLTGGQRSVEHVAISDLLPSGFEIENPRIGQSADLAWVEAAANKLTPDYLDVRDDRLLLYCTAPAQKTEDYYYLIRVVNAGTFSQAAIGAEAMYAPQCNSYHGGGTVKVNRESGGS